MNGCEGSESTGCGLGIGERTAGEPCLPLPVALPLPPFIPHPGSVLQDWNANCHFKSKARRD